MDIDKEIEAYCKKKREDIEKTLDLEEDETLFVLNEVMKEQRKIAKKTLCTHEEIKSLKKEGRESFKEGYLVAYDERLQGLIIERDKLREEKEELLERERREKERYIKTLINIIDEIYRLKYYAEKSGKEGLLDTISKNISFIKKELRGINIEVKSSLGEEFNEDFHNCIEVREDLEGKNMTIVQEIKLCIILEGKVIRPADVVVIKN